MCDPKWGNNRVIEVPRAVYDFIARNLPPPEWPGPNKIVFMDATGPVEIACEDRPCPKCGGSGRVSRRVE